VPEFRGANRTLIPQWLLVVMHHSGLFDPWRMPIATGISYFAPAGAEAEGGELAFYPDGADGAVQTIEPRHNTAVVLDTDSVFHGVDRVGPVGAPPVEVAPGNVLRFVGGRWELHRGRDDHTVVNSFAWSDIRFSVSWKAYCFIDTDDRDRWRLHSDDLSIDFILESLVDDLARRGAVASRDHALSDKDLAVLLIDTYEVFPDARQAPSSR
jgi:hypothetical protein